MTDAAITPPEASDIDAPTGGAELDFGREHCALLTHEAAIAKADGMVIVRVFGHGSAAALKHVGMTPARAMRLGARFIQAAMHADPSLIGEFDQIIASARGRGLRVIEKGGAE